MFRPFACLVACLLLAAPAPAAAEVLFSGDAYAGFSLRDLQGTGSTSPRTGWRFEHGTRFDLGLMRETDIGLRIGFTLRLQDGNGGPLPPGAVHMHLPQR